MTKKNVAFTLTLALSLSLSLVMPTTTFAAEISMKVGDKALAFQYAEPFIEDGRTLTPLRDLLVALGVPDDQEHIIWNKDKQSVSVIYKDINVELTVGSRTIYKNNHKFADLDVSPKLVNDRVFIPARAVAEALGNKVIYDATTRTVLINSGTITYSDLSKLNSVVRATIQKLKGIDLKDLQGEQKESLEYLLLIDKKQLAGALLDSFELERAAVLDFIAKYMLNDLNCLIEKAVDPASPAAYGTSMTDLITALPADPVMEQLAKIMKNSSNEQVRDAISFYLYKFPTSKSLKILEEELAVESSDKVFSNAAVSYQSIGRSMPSTYVESLFNSYLNASDKQREKYKSYLLLNVRNHDSTKEQWNALLKNKSSSKTELEKQTAEELLKLK
ncbi:copper amine oxidase N-terminal domain-containing protein [Paenibacillus albiflavus]|nr:copper amine oxidase N-terminal domain-containing protein [Paenibacillus albiflavus]